MSGGGKGMTIARVNSILHMTGADREAREIVNAAGVKISDPGQDQGCSRAVDVTKLREDLLLKLEVERSEAVVALRAKQRQIMADKKGREAELLELQKAEESHRELLLKDRDERNKIAKSLHGLRRGHLVRMEEETRRELASLQHDREMLQEREKDSLNAIDEVRRQIMEQDEVYHRAMEEARSKIKNGKSGVDRDGRPLADAARIQRQAIQSDQVALAEVYGKSVGTLQEEQMRLQDELQNVDERIQKARKDGLAPSKGAEDALAALMTEAGMEEQAKRLRRLKVELEKQHTEDVSGGFIKAYEGAEAKTRGALKSSARFLDGRMGEYAEATADAFLDDWLKTDADRAREVAAAAAASARKPLSPHVHTPPLDRSKHEDGIGVPDADKGMQGRRGRRPSATLPGNGAAAPPSHKEKRDGHDHHGHHHHVRREGIGGRHAHEAEPSSRGPARTRSSGSNGSEGGRSKDSVATGGASHGKQSGNGVGGHDQRHPHQRRRNAVTKPLQLTTPNGTTYSPRVDDSDGSGAEHHRRRSQEDIHHAANEPLSSYQYGLINPATEHRSGQNGEAAGDGGDGGDAKQGRAPPESEILSQAQDIGKEPEILRRTRNESAQLRAAVERLERELSSVKAGTGICNLGMAGVQGDGFGSAGGNRGMPLGATVDPTADSTWMAGGIAVPGLQHYLASLDAENARLMAEIQGLSFGGGAGGNLGLAGLGGDPKMGTSSLLLGAGTAAGRRGVGYLGPGMHGNEGGSDGARAGVEQGPRSGGAVARKRDSSATRGGGSVGAEWDGAVLGCVGNEELSPRNREYRRRMVEMDAEHKEAVKRLEFEMQRLELEQQLEDMRERMARERKTRQQDIAHEQWVTEQKRNLQAIKIEKTLAKERQLMEVQQTLAEARGGGAVIGGRHVNGLAVARTAEQAIVGWRPGVGGIMQRTYNQDNGFCVFWDYLTGLPKKSGSKIIGKVRLAFGLYVGKRLHDRVLSTPWADIAARSFKNESTGRPETFAKLEALNAFPGIPPQAQTRLVMELQFKDDTGVQGKGKKGTLGWGIFYVFKAEKGNPHRLTVRSCRTRLTLFPGSMDLRIANVNDDKSAVSRSIPTAAFIRLVHGEDMNQAAAFVVDPETQHLYEAYGRGNVSQMERQKFMTGTFLRAILVLGKLKRSLTSRKRPKAIACDLAKELLPLQNGTRRRDSSKRALSFSLPSADRPEPQLEDAGGTVTGDEEQTEKPKPDEQAARQEEEGPAESSESKEQDPSEEEEEEEDSEGDSKNVEDGENRPKERRRSSLSSLHAQLAGQKAMSRRASLSKRQRGMTSRQPFLKGDGFDVYVDRACGMPYMCTVSKAVIKVIGDVGDKGESSEISKADSPSSNPVFGLRQEYRTGPESRMDMTSTIMIRVDTLDRFSSEHQAVGYALLAVFMDPSGNQPTNAIADGAFLREGNYQVPLRRKPPPEMRRVTSKTLDKFPRVPCASVLVRVKPASKSSAGKTLSRADVAEDEWKKFGLAPPIPQFAPGVYDNSDLQLTDLERQVLELRSKDKHEETVRGAGKLIRLTNNPALASDSKDGDKVFEEWAKHTMAMKPSKMVKYHLSERYRPDHGFSVAVAGLTKMKAGAFTPTRLYKVIYSLLVPGLFYLGDPPASDQAEFTHTYDPLSSQLAPRFKDPPHAFRNQPVNELQFIVLDVRFLKIDAKKHAALPEEPSVTPASGAWGLLPAFASGDLATGSFVVPLLTGPVPLEILQSENPMKKMMDGVKAKLPSFRALEGSSVVVQICNALLQDVLPEATQDPALNYVCVKRIADALRIPQSNYAFELVVDAGQKSVARIVPKGFAGRSDDFFTSANVLFAQATGTTYTARPNVVHST